MNDPPQADKNRKAERSADVVFSERAEFRKLGVLPGGAFRSLCTQRTIKNSLPKVKRKINNLNPPIPFHLHICLLTLFQNFHKSISPLYQL